MSFELRWFRSGSASDGELARFGEGSLEQRTDLYLLGTGPALGIKRRGGSRLERKQRIAAVTRTLEVGDLRRSITIERWRKTWLASPPPSATPSSWAAVRKRRARRRIAGALAELTELHLELPDQSALAFTTLALETGGAHARALETLELAARTLFERHGDVCARYRAAACMGYPEWLTSQA